MSILDTLFRCLNQVFPYLGFINSGFLYMGSCQQLRYIIT